MGSFARMGRAGRFIEEFGADIIKLAIQDRGHEVHLAQDADAFVRLWVVVGEFEYMSDVVVFNPEAICDDDMIEDVAGQLGLLPSVDNGHAAVIERLKKAELL